MPFAMDLDSIALMEKSGVNAKFSCYSGNPADPDPIKQAPRHVCAMIDDQTGEKVLEADGDGRVVAFKAACKKLAALNRKPAMQSLADNNADLTKQRDELAAQLAKLRGDKPSK